jgi:hypothetical protein
MVIGKIKPTATIVAQFAAGVEIESIQHDGKMYLPIVTMGDFSVKEEPEKVPVSPAKPETPSAEVSREKVYTKEELMAMDPKELIKICKDEFGINPEDYDGKNTNKKLRDLILGAQENPEPLPTKKKEEDDEDSDDGASEDEDSELIDSIAEILEDFDSGKKTKKKSLSAIYALSENPDEDAIAELVDNFEEDGDCDLDETASKISKLFGAKSKAPKSKKEKEDLVSPEDLEVGDRISVWWNDDNQEWYDGEVASIKRGKVTVDYDDGTSGVIDTKIHTKIKRITE